MRIQGNPEQPDGPTDGSIADGEEHTYTASDTMGVWEFQNESQHSCVVAFAATAQSTGANLEKYAAFKLKAGETRAFEVLAAKATVRNIGTAPIKTKDTGAGNYDKELWVRCWLPE